MHRNIIIFFVAFLAALSLSAQNGTLKGTVTDAITGETIPMANIVVKSDGVTIIGGASDFDGNFTIKPITPGTYTVEISFIGYATVRQTNVLISPDKITFSDYQMSLEANVLTEVQVIEYDVPLIDADKSGSTKTKEQITSLPTRSVQNVAATTAGVYQEDTGGALNVRGSRSNATAYYVDGVKIVGSTNVLPQAAIDQMTVVTGGLPAQYGDATGGIISIVTSGPSRITRAGLEISSSKFLDPYNHNLAAFNVSGPIWRKRDEDRTPVLSYLLTAEYNYKGDYDPSAIGVPVLNEDKLNDLEKEPSIFFGEPSYFDWSSSYSQNQADTLQDTDWTISDTYQNKTSQNLKAQAKITLAITKDIDFIIGGNTSRSGWYDGAWANQLLNSANNYYSKTASNNVYVRLQHRLSGDDGGSVKNLFYTLQADYSSYSRLIEHEDHRDNFFLYNYVGKFTKNIDDVGLTQFQASIPQTWSQYEVFVLDENDNKIPRDQNGDGVQDQDETGELLWETEVHTGALVQEYEIFDFDASDANPLLANYTQQYYDWLDEYADEDDVEGADWSPSWDHLSQNAIINGWSTPGVNSLWYNIGMPMGFYVDQDEHRRRFTGSASADIGNHAISFGFEYEKKTERYYRLYTDQLWQTARQLANRHLLGFEQYYVDDNVQNTHPFGDDVLLISTFYDQDEDNESYSTFGQNIREQLNLGVNDLVFIDELNPEDLSLDLFAADEILQEDDYYLYYYGYDHMGNEVNEPVSFDQFLNDQDENGDYTRRVGPFQPLYSAAYIQDKFSFDDIVFNVGVRVDRYDANQEVLKDKYSLYPTVDVKEMRRNSNKYPVLSNYDHPSNIGDDFVVYANSITDQNIIMGYRDGDDWYDAEGTSVTDPSVLDAGVGVTPFLKEPNHNAEENYGLTADAFEDYTPQITVMPRISFNFPISDEAMFFAHYDILTQRPSSSNRTNPFEYLFLASNAGNVDNGNLKPERTTDYEVGFTQALTKHSAVTISAFYRELDDMIQMTRVAAAYPMPYTHYDNIDFGTVKGLSFGYDLRRRNNVQLTATYTLQFADGTGSSATTASTLISNGFPNLRTTLPLDFDQRHNISTNIDYRFGFGPKYNGPIIFGRQLLEGVGANLLIAAGSGTPYSQQTEATEEAKYGIPIRTTLKGSVNGARKPWSFRADLRINKDLKMKISENRDLKMDVYMLIENIFDAANVISVYRYTGNPDDDGYLTSDTGNDDANENAINADAFRDQYSLKINNPNNYARPRLIKLGMKVNF